VSFSCASWVLLVLNPRARTRLGGEVGSACEDVRLGVLVRM